MKKIGLLSFFGNSKHPTKHNTVLEVNGTSLPVTIVYEHRNNVRFSFGRKQVYCRIPHLMLPSEKEQHLKRFEQWVTNQFNSNEKLQQQFIKKQYQDGDQITVGRYTYSISMEMKDRKSHTASIKGTNIHMELSTHDTDQNRQKSIRHLLSRTIARHRQHDIEQCVHFWNDRYFQKPINGIRIKLNQSNWGSCSSKGNINLSSRLLFAPQEVIDYVIVHELAHLIEMNHSPAFWKVVSDVMPDYDLKEQWLKQHGHLCQF